MNTKIILNKIKFTKIFAPPIQLNRRKLTLDRTGPVRPAKYEQDSFSVFRKTADKSLPRYRLGCPGKV